jgi:hypothetical protein
MNTEPLTTYGVDFPTGPRGVELMPRRLVYGPDQAEPLAARIGLYGAKDGVSELHVPFGAYFPAGDQVFRLEGWKPGPDRGDPARAGGPSPYKLAISWFGDAPPGGVPADVTEVTALHRALPVTPPCGFTIAAATARGAFDTEGMVIIRIDGPDPYEIGVRYGDEFTVSGRTSAVDGWTVPDPATGDDTPMLRLRR